MQTNYGEIIMEILKKLMNCQSVSGRENKVTDLIADMLKGHVDEIKKDNMGNLIAFKKGSAENAKKLMLAAHTDEIGFIVTHIEDKGFIRINSVGGIDFAAAAYSVVEFENGVKGVLVPESGVGAGDYRQNKFVVDIGAKDRKSAEKLVHVADTCAVCPSVTKLSNGFYSGRPFDDKIGCAIMVRAALACEKPVNDTYYVFTVQEEVGCRGAKTSAFSVAPDFSLAYDVTGSGDSMGAKPMEVYLGKGAAVKVKDSSVIADITFVRAIEKIAKENKIPYQLEILEAGGTDTSAMQMAGAGSRASALSVPTRYIHSVNEVINKKDYDACVDLTVAILNTDLREI